MVSGQPPRHSKSDKPPVIIDLDAEPEVRAGEEAATETASTTEPTPAAEPASAPETVVDPAPEAPTSPDVEPAAAPLAKSPSSRPPQVSTLIATGIIGGIVALAAAGAMQYAGYLPGASTTASPAGVTQADLDALKASIPAPAGDSTALEARIASLEQVVAGLKQAPAGADTAAVEALGAKLDALAKDTADLDSRLQQAAPADAISTLDARLTAAEKKLAEPRDDVAVAEAIAASSLKAAAERGGPFATELDTIAAMRPDDPAVTGLKPFAATGAPTRADLLEGFPAAATAMIDATEATTAEDGVIDRLWGSARKMISVRPVGNVPGTDPAAVIARIEDKLKNGDLKGATIEFDALPPAAKEAGAAFRTSLDARLKVDELTGALVATTVAKTRQTQ